MSSQFYSPERQQSFEKNSDHQSLNFSDVMTQDASQKNSNAEPFRICTSAEMDQYVKDRVLPACSIEGALQQNVNNGNWDGVVSANKALSARQEEFVKETSPATPTDPQSELERLK